MGSCAVQAIFGHLGNTKKFDPIPHVSGMIDIINRNLTDPFQFDRIEINLNAIGDS